ncbi:MAG TPA: hypothetical protein VF133_14075 [Terriglobales bacterium]
MPTRCKLKIVLQVALAFLLVPASLTFAQQNRRDPLNDLEVDKLRDAAQDPDIRLKLYVEFARARLDKMQQVHADPKAQDGDEQTKSALQDFIDIYDELQDNIDTFADRKDDLRKALKPVIEADTEFGSKLRAFKSSLANSPQEAGKFDFLLGTALSAVDDGAKNDRELLAQQEETFKHKKKTDHKDSAQRE